MISKRLESGRRRQLDRPARSRSGHAERSGSIITSHLPSYVTLDAMISYPVTDYFSLQLNSYNLANEFYYANSYFTRPDENHAMPGAGRTFLLTADCHCNAGLFRGACRRTKSTILRPPGRSALGRRARHRRAAIEGGKAKPTTSRTCAQARELGERVLAALNDAPVFLSAALPARVFPPLFNRYANGMGFGAHIDNAIRRVPGSRFCIRTDLSATLFLNPPESYDGGELVIEDTLWHPIGEAGGGRHDPYIPPPAVTG